MMAAGLFAFSPAVGVAGIDNQPALVPPQNKPPPKGTRVDVIADRLTYDDKTKLAIATGTVQLTYGAYVLTATKVVYDMAARTLKANGSIVLREPNGNVFEADSAELKDTFREGFANYVRALLTNNVTITAQYARRYENGITIYERASYTACKTCVSANGTPVWQIVAREAKHDEKNETIYYRDAVLKFGEVPVFWTPYFAYPDPTVQRRTGFLIPSYKTGDFGFGVVTPFFWAPKPNMDMTFAPMWTTARGVLGDLEFRHRLASGAYEVRGYGIHETTLSSGNPSDDPWRGGARTQGDFRINEDWTWGWDGTVVSDKNFLSNYGLDSRTMIADYVQATGLSDRNYTKAQIIGWQSLVDGESQHDMPIATPFVVGDYVLENEVLGGELSFGFNAYSLQRDRPINDPARSGEPGDNSGNPVPDGGAGGANGNQAGSNGDSLWSGVVLGTYQAHITGYADWKRQLITEAGLAVTPFANVRTDFFYAENVPRNGPGNVPAPSSDQTSDFYAAPTAGVDVRMPFVNAMGSLQSVLTPVAQVIASPSEPNLQNTGNEDAITLNFDTTNLFLSDRFTGYDRWEGGVRANAGVIYTLMGQEGGFLRASFGESFHIAGTNSFLVGSGLNGTASDLVGGLALQVNPNLTVGYQARFEEDLSRVNVQETMIGLNLGQFSGSINYADIGKAANYGRPDNEKQVWADGRYTLFETWSVFGGVRYNLKTDKVIDQRLGVTFDCDCMRASVIYSMSRTDAFGPADGGFEQRIDLSVELRTIGEIAGGFQLE